MATEIAQLAQKLKKFEEGEDLKATRRQLEEIQAEYMVQTKHYMGQIEQKDREIYSKKVQMGNL
jgi:hypothetical protein